MTTWPAGMAVDPIGEWPGTLTAKRRRSAFDSTMDSTMGTLRRELRELQAKDIRMQIAVPPEQFRLDGFPRATAKPEHPGVILTFGSKHGPLSYPCDTFTEWRDNLRAIALALEALRMVARYNVTKHGEQYRGFLALESFAMPAATVRDTARAIRIITEATGIRTADFEHNPLAAIRRAKFRTHPDTITVDNDPGDYELVVAAEQHLKQNGNI